MYGKNLESILILVDMLDESGSSVSSEDETGKLMNEKTQQDFLVTMAKLRAKDSSIYKENKHFF